MSRITKKVKQAKMNIFATSKCPVRSARALDDKRVVKMILESAQMLSTALILSGAPESLLPVTKFSNEPYKVAHKNHPCTIWARTTKGNYLWLWEHFRALTQEYRIRYNRSHYLSQFTLKLADGADYIPEGPKKPFANCSLYKEIPTLNAYRMTMIHKWRNDKRKPTWKRNKNVPSWVLKTELINL